MNDNHIQMVERFQCPGCIAGSDVKCGRFEWKDRHCNSHIAGTILLGCGNIVLGLPKGFNKTGFYLDRSTGKLESANKIELYLYDKTEQDQAAFWNNCNVPVWAMERDGYLFIRVYMPRINHSMLQVIEGGTLQSIKDKGFNPLNVADFEDEID